MDNPNADPVPADANVHRLRLALNNPASGESSSSTPISMSSPREVLTVNDKLVCSRQGRFRKIREKYGGDAFRLQWKAFDTEKGREVTWDSFFRPVVCKFHHNGVPSLVNVCLERLAELHARKIFRCKGDEDERFSKLPFRLSEAMLLQVFTRSAKFQAQLAYKYICERMELLRRRGLEAHEHLLSTLHMWHPDPPPAEERRNWAEGFICITEWPMSNTLFNLVVKAGGLNRAVIITFCKELLSALDFLHSQKPPIVHHGVRARNIFIDRTSGRLKLGNVGFGIVRYSTRNLFSVIGYPEWMAPEYFCPSKVTEKVDIYAFGMCLLEMLVACRPYCECSDTAEVVQRIMQGQEPLAVEVVEEKLDEPNLVKLIRMCLEYEPEKRPSASELLKSNLLDNLKERKYITPPKMKKNHETKDFTQLKRSWDALPVVEFVNEMTLRPGIGLSKDEQYENKFFETAEHNYVVSDEDSSDSDSDSESSPQSTSPRTPTPRRPARLQEINIGHQLRQNNETPPPCDDDETDSPSTPPNTLLTQMGVTNPNPPPPSPLHPPPGEGSSSVVVPLQLSIKVQGQTHTVMFDFDIHKDSPHSVALELVGAMSIPQDRAHVIESTIRKQLQSKGYVLP